MFKATFEIAATTLLARRTGWIRTRRNSANQRWLWISKVNLSHTTTCKLNENFNWKVSRRSGKENLQTNGHSSHPHNESPNQYQTLESTNYGNTQRPEDDVRLLLLGEARRKFCSNIIVVQRPAWSAILPACAVCYRRIRWISTIQIKPVGSTVPLGGPWWPWRITTCGGILIKFFRVLKSEAKPKAVPY